LVPLYRAYRPLTDDHFYTMNLAERDIAVQYAGYSAEGVTGYVLPSYIPINLSGPVLIPVPLYRMYGPGH